MAVTGPNTGFKIINVDGSTYTQDLGQRYVSKDYLIDAYPNIARNAGLTSPGVWSWGNNLDGLLGQNVQVHRSSPVQIGSLTDWRQIAGGNFHSLAIKNDGTLWAWGRGASGQLGDNDPFVYKSSPIQIGALTNWKSVAGATNCSFAVKIDGTLWQWGDGSFGQSGYTGSRSSPVQVGTLTNWKQVSGSPISYFAGAVKTDGTLWMWGWNNSGQLGDGTVVNKSSPVQVGTLTNWKQLDVALSTHSAAIKTDGTLWMWGGGFSGSLGQGVVYTITSSPVQVGALTNWKLISSGRYSSAAIKTDGTLWTWGHNHIGQLGNGDLVHRSSPIQIGSLTNWKQIGSGEYSSAAIKTDGTLWTWGRNADGQLGDGTTVHRSSPVQIGALTNWKLITRAVNHVLSIQDGNY